MARNFAIAIGINGYEHLGQPLKYAKRDAELIRNFFLDEMKFEEVFSYTDDSPPIQGASTRPSRPNLLGLFNNLFKEPFLEAGDNFWFFFSGHGEIYDGQDYLMTCDAYPGLVQDTAISTNYVIQRLRRCGADNVILMLDACRNSNRKSAQGVGKETSKLVSQTGIISLFSCSPSEYSYEIDELQQGAFTYALVESLRLQGEGNCATVERLNNRLRYRVTEINQRYHKPRQTPYTTVEPLSKGHLILLEKQATEGDISQLISDAQDAEIENNLQLAEQLWTRVLAVSPANPKALARLRKIWQKHPTPTPQPSPQPPNNNDLGSKSSPRTTTESPQSETFSTPSFTRRRLIQLATYTGAGLVGVGTTAFLGPKGINFFNRNRPLVISPPDPNNKFSFNVVTLDKTGKEINRQRNSAEYFTEDLGNGVTLDMVKIPAGEFLMGSPESEEGSSDSERPQHQVRVHSFFMGKYPVTQAQWQAVASLDKLQRDLNPDPSRFKGKNRPVEQISWYDAVEFCARLSKHTGKSYCLPSEAQWEYACRAGTTTPFHFGETISTDVANYNGNETYGSGSKGVYRQETTPVGSFQVANNFGLFDMHGNVWEWCADPTHENYEGAPADGSVWDKNINDNRYKNYVDNLVNLLNVDSDVVLRGGSWVSDPYNCRSACRDFINRRDFIDDYVGFRVLCVPGLSFAL